MKIVDLMAQRVGIGGQGRELLVAGEPVASALRDRVGLVEACGVEPRQVEIGGLATVELLVPATLGERDAVLLVAT